MFLLSGTIKEKKIAYTPRILTENTDTEDI
jgi:hypothetical protein